MALKLKTRRGIGLVEVVISAAIIAFVVLSIVAGYTFHFRIGLEIPNRVQATLYADEAVDGMRFLRDGGWTANIVPLVAGTTYYLSTTTSGVVLSTTPQILPGGFVRTIVLSAVSRDANGNIVSSGGTNDAGSRLLTVNVAWRGASATTTRSMQTYITNLFSN